MFFAFIFESVGGTEWLVLLGVVLIVVGPKNLPSAARKLGQIMSTLRRAADEFKRQLLSMDEEIRRTVDEAVKTDYVETPKEDADASQAPDPSTVPDDLEGASPAGADGVDRAEAESGVSVPYDMNSPYPGNYYDETRYQPATADSAGSSATGNAEESGSVATSSEPERPKADPYAITISVSPAPQETSRKKGGKA